MMKADDGDDEDDEKIRMMMKMKKELRKKTTRKGILQSFRYIPMFIIGNGIGKRICVSLL